MWNAKQELVKKSVELAKEKHPEGFNKKQLVASSKEVYGGYGEVAANPHMHKTIKTMDDVNHMGNAMAQIDGHYPVGMSGCYVVGINGDCGLECPVYLGGDCENDGEMFCADSMSEDEIHTHFELYAAVCPEDQADCDGCRYDGKHCNTEEPTNDN